jgi:hypothetical protein
MEPRLLPGEILGLAHLASISLLLDATAASTAPSQDLAASPLVLHQQTSSSLDPAGSTVVVTNPAMVSGSQDTQSTAAPNTTRDLAFASQASAMPFAADPLRQGDPFAGDPLRLADLFATRGPLGGTPLQVPSNPRAGGDAAQGGGPAAQSSPGTFAPRTTGAVPTPVATKLGGIDFGFSPLPTPSRLVRPTTISPLDGMPSWNSYAHDAQHTALADVASLSLNDGIRWRVPVDLSPPAGLGIHYGSPVITSNNTVIVSVKTAPDYNAGWRLEAHSGADGHLMWTQTTSYSPPPYDWVPSYSAVLTAGGRLYYPGPGGTVYYCDNPDTEGATVTGQLAFYGIDNYNHNPSAYDNTVKIDTPLTADSNGTIYFGFQTSGSPPLGLSSGIARMDVTGAGTWVAAGVAAGDPNVTRPHMNSAPALSNDQSTLYAALRTDGSDGYLVALNTATLQPLASVYLQDPRGGSAAITSDSTSSPMVGWDGDVYYGVLENPFDHNDRGWLLHFSSDLSQTKTPASFGWDNTPSLVPASMVPGYTGSSAYLLMCKYNNYAGIGTGDGVNKIAVLDPNATEPDPVLPNVTVMGEVLTIAGVTPDPDFPNYPGAVREWCINTAAVDQYTESILVNSEDGTLYRWDMVTNTFTESINLEPPTSEAYTPTLVGPDGAVYAINNSVLFAVG